MRLYIESQYYILTYEHMIQKNKNVNFVVYLRGLYLVRFKGEMIFTSEEEDFFYTKTIFLLFFVFSASSVNCVFSWAKSVFFNLFLNRDFFLSLSQKAEQRHNL